MTSILQLEFMSFLFHEGIPLGIQIHDIQSCNDGDVAIYTLFLKKLRTVRPDQLIVDVGACDAAFSLVAASLAPNPVYAFEPNRHSYFKILQTLKDKQIQNIYVFPLAISTADSEIFLEEAGGSSNLRENKGSMSVITKPMSAIIEPSRSIFFMKVDTEGFDLQVLESCKPFLESGGGGIDNIVFEYSAFWVGSSAEECIANSAPMLTYLCKKYKYMYSLSRRGPPFLVGPLAESDIPMFIYDHYVRHLQTDIFLTNSAVEHADIPCFPFEPNKYYA